MCLKALAGSVSAAMPQVTMGPLGKPTGSMELPEEPVMASVGPICLVITCSANSFSLGKTDAMVVGE